MNTVIQEYRATEAALAELRQKYAATVYEVRTPAGMLSAKKARAELRDWRVSLEKERVRIKAPSLERCKAIDSEAKRITDELAALEAPIDAAIKAEEKRKEEEKAARERADSERMVAARAAVDAIGAPLLTLVGRPSDEIAEKLSKTNDLVVDGYVLEAEARAAKSAAIAKLNEMLVATLTHEFERKCIDAERAELARIQAEQEERERQEALARAAAEAESRAKIEAELRAARERIENELRAKEEEARRMREEENMRVDARTMLASFVDRYGNLPEFSKVARFITAFLEGGKKC